MTLMLALRLSGEDREVLEELVRRRAARLADEGVAVTTSSVIRSLIRQAAVAEGIKLSDDRPRKTRS